jgi:predicted dehydrogenase
LTRITSALVGLGSISFEHIEKLRALTEVEIVGLCDLHPTVARAVWERFGVGRPFTDLEQMLAETEPQVVHVLTPPQSHPALAIRALEAGAHVFVEKPIAAGWDDYVEMREAAQRAGRLLVENYNWRFVGVVERAMRIWEEGVIGEVVHVDVAFGGVMGDGGGDPSHFSHRLPGGPLQNFASHPLSIALAFMGGGSSVGAAMRRLDPEGTARDELRALLAGERSTGLVSVTRHAEPPEFTLRVQGTAGTIEAELYSARLYVDRPGAGPARVVNGVRHGVNYLVGAASFLSRTLTSRLDNFEGLATLLDRFYRAVADGAEPPVSIAEMDAVNRVMSELFGGEGRR